MPAERAGYQVSVFAIDVSPSMGEVIEDPSGSSSSSSSSTKGKKASLTKLDLAKEYVARRCEPKISSGRKTEAVGILSYGGKTNNQANRAFVETNPDDEDPPYAAVACDVAIQTAKPKIVETVMNLEVGDVEGNPVSALMVALDMIHVHKHTKSWALEVILVTDGESAFKQDEYEDAMQRFDDMGVKLQVVGMGFEPLGKAVDKSKSRNKRLSEKFWRTFVEMLHERISTTTSAEEMLPDYTPFESSLLQARLPRCAFVNSVLSGIDLHIGSPEIDPSQSITIPIKFSKATMKARPPTLSKAWKPAMDLQDPSKSHVGGAGGGQSQGGTASQLMSTLASQSQQSKNGPSASDLAGLISAEVKHHSTYVVKKADPAAVTAGGTQGTQGKGMPGSQVNYGNEGLDTDYIPGEEQEEGGEAEEEEDEEIVPAEDIVKAWRFGSTWVPMEKDTFEPLETNKGVEVLGFFPQENIKRHHLMGEVRYIWPDITSPKAQIQFSSLVEGMHLRGMCAVVRWVLKDRAEPVIGLCVPEFSYPGEDRRLDFMFWVQLPFAEDEHNFWFNSLTNYKTSSGKVITEHPLLPTKEQCQLMDDLVDALDLDAYALEQLQKDKGHDDEEMNPDDEEGPPTWFDPINSYNPVIHRIKEAIFHASLTEDLNKDPLGPPHPELVKYFETPRDLLDKTEKLAKELKEVLDIKKVPPKVRAKKTKEGLREGEGYIDIDEFFDEAPAGTSKKGETQTTPKKVKNEPESPHSTKKGKAPATRPHDDDDDSDSPADIKASQHTPHAKPKKGRIISNENPLEDFTRVTKEGDVFRKAIQDMALVVKENVETSFSRQAFPLAIDCLKRMRKTALTYEEVETCLEDLEKTVKAKGFKHSDFWNFVEKAGKDVAKITKEEEQAALEGDGEEEEDEEVEYESS